MSDQIADQSGNIPQPSEDFGNVPHDAEPFGTFRNVSEGFRSIPHTSVRKENHTLTVRDVARLFAEAGVLRTERSVVNWCGGSETHPSRLDAYYDRNDRKYFITPESVATVIAEEKAQRQSPFQEPVSEPTPEVRNVSESARPTRASDDTDHAKKIKDLEQELMDLKITNKAKDFFIEQLKNDREHFTTERQALVTQLMDHTHRIGQLETTLQIAAPTTTPPPTRTRTITVSESPLNENLRDDTDPQSGEEGRVPA